MFKMFWEADLPAADEATNAVPLSAERA